MSVRLRLLAPLLFVTGCASPSEDPALGPYRSLVEIVAELGLARDVDLYRFDAPRDVTGENVWRATLRRLENFESLVEDPRFRPALRFAQAECRERLADFATAAALWREVASLPGAESVELKETAASRVALCEELAARTAPVDANEARSPDDLVRALATQRMALKELLTQHAADPRACLIECAIERQDVREREYLWRVRAFVDDGAQLALDSAQRVIANHVDSRRVHEHRLRLADFYAELARGYVVAVDPTQATFDTARARNLIQAAGRMYAEVAAIDGIPEREEARAGIASLEALLDRIASTAP
ncbi:MAG: hypothetical protein IPH13_00885 [Planctomycetes bacterium]|nr:hypothetical protein [Planctomycetota bacterium]MCC7172455.1 hypothetical protein [Planctomycetota bacterium]